jgi:hypothetical protein
MLIEIQRRILQNLSLLPGARPVAIAVSQPQLKNGFWAPYLCYENVMQMWLDA